VSRRFEGGEECDTEAAVGHGVEQAMGGCHCCEVSCERDQTASAAAGEANGRNDGPQDHCKSEGMAEAAVPQQVAVMDPEAEAGDIQIGQRGARDRQDPHASLARRRAAQGLSGGESKNGVGEDRGHVSLLNMLSAEPPTTRASRLPARYPAHIVETLWLQPIQQTAEDERLIQPARTKHKLETKVMPVVG
jgi:hypothetical protein